MTQPPHHQPPEGPGDPRWQGGPSAGWDHGQAPGGPGGPGGPTGPGGPGQPPGQPWGPQPMTPGEEQGWGVACHLGGAFLSFLVPLIVWLIFRDRSRMLDDHGKTALNFQITLAIAYVASIILILVSFGVLFPVIFVVLIVQIVFAILASVAAYNRQPYVYPVAIPFIR